MKKVIRKGVFESNSSSTHAIAICPDRECLVIPAQLHFGFDAYGWRSDKLTTPEEKASYLHTAIACIYRRSGYSDVINHIFSVLFKYDCEATFETPQWDEWHGDGYLDISQGCIDHCADGEIGDFIKKVLRNDNLLYRYLFSNKAFVITGNDNSESSYVDPENNYGAEYFFYKGN